MKNKENTRVVCFLYQKFSVSLHISLNRKRYNIKHENQKKMYKYFIKCLLQFDREEKYSTQTTKGKVEKTGYEKVYVI